MGNLQSTDGDAATNTALGLRLAPCSCTDEQIRNTQGKKCFFPLETAIFSASMRKAESVMPSALKPLPIKGNNHGNCKEDPGQKSCTR